MRVCVCVCRWGEGVACRQTLTKGKVHHQHDIRGLWKDESNFTIREEERTEEKKDWKQHEERPCSLHKSRNSVLRTFLIE